MWKENLRIGGRPVEEVALIQSHLGVHEFERVLNKYIYIEMVRISLWCEKFEPKKEFDSLSTVESEL